MSSTPAVRLERLSKSFRVCCPRGEGAAARLHDYVRPLTRDVVAVDDLSFSIQPGERVAFIGPNGAGKSTTLKMLAGILQPDTGAARVLGLVPFRQRRQLAFRVGTVFGQRSQLWYQLPPRDTFQLLARVYEIDGAVYRRRLEALISIFGIAPFFDTPVRQLSLGDRMRCEIAASLLHAPAVLFLDEPTIGLDVAAKALIQNLLRDESARDGVTLLLTSHDTGDIEKICDRAIVIQGGRLLWDGPIAELRRRYLTTRRVTVWSEAETTRPVAARRSRDRLGRLPHRSGSRTRRDLGRARRRRGAQARGRARSGDRRSAARHRHPHALCERAAGEGAVMRPPALVKYLAFTRIAAARTWRARGDLYGRVVFFAVILGVFSSLWQAVAETGMPIAAGPGALVWYLAITEWIVMSAPPIHLEIQEAIRRGDVVCQLGRPVSYYVGAAFAEGLGILLVRAPVLFVTGCACAFAFTRTLPPPMALASAAGLGFCAAALITALCLGIGLLAFWLGEVAPVWWVFQKALFVFGGLMMPLALYPDVIQRIAAATPFPAALAGPACWCSRGADPVRLMLALALWGAATGVGLWLLFRRAALALTLNGG